MVLFHWTKGPYAYVLVAHHILDARVRRPTTHLMSTNIAEMPQNNQLNYFSHILRGYQLV